MDKPSEVNTHPITAAKLQGVSVKPLRPSSEPTPVKPPRRNDGIVDQNSAFRELVRNAFQVIHGQHHNTSVDRSYTFANNRISTGSNRGPPFFYRSFAPCVLIFPLSAFA